jgi:hypothetical protein
MAMESRRLEYGNDHARAFVRGVRRLTAEPDAVARNAQVERLQQTFPSLSRTDILAASTSRDNRVALFRKAFADAPLARLPTGLQTPHEHLDAQVSRIVDQARANADAGPIGKLSTAGFAPVAKTLIGMNAGDDQIVDSLVYRTVLNIIQPRRAPETPYGFREIIHFLAFDRAGHHVLHASAVPDEDDGKALHLCDLEAAHGRSVRANWEGGQAQMPGRGNPRVVGAFFRGLIRASVAQEFSKLTLALGSDKVRKVYEKIGFISEGSGMALYLTNPAAVRQAMLHLSSRVSQAHVPQPVVDVPGSTSPRRASYHRYFGYECEPNFEPTFRGVYDEQRFSLGAGRAVTV